MTTNNGPKVTIPSRSVYDRRFRYVNAAHTDVRRTWRKATLYMALKRKETNDA